MRTSLCPRLSLISGLSSTAGGAAQTLTVSEWRAAAWNRYYDNTPFSWDVTSPNISDAPPFRLSWTMGTDAPLPQKDGHGCLFANRYFVIAGGVAGHVWPGPDGAGAAEHVGTGDGSEVPATAVMMYARCTHASLC